MELFGQHQLSSETLNKALLLSCIAGSTEITTFLVDNEDLDLTQEFKIDNLYGATFRPFTERLA